MQFAYCILLHHVLDLLNRSALVVSGFYSQCPLSPVVYQMLKHGRAGVPMEVMGLMLGEFVDDYTVRVIDVFAMPQSGTVRTRLLLCST